MKKSIILVLALVMLFSMTGCVVGDVSAAKEQIKSDTQKTVIAAGTLQSNQPTPTDIDYSLERYNLIRRAYWVNGQREKANTLVCEVEKPLGYVVLFTEGGSIIGRFVVDGKVSSLNSFLTPDYNYYGVGTGDSSYLLSVPQELADVDGSYGENDSGIFFFTVDGKYIEYTGEYLYSDIPFEVENPVLTIGEE